MKFILLVILTIVLFLALRSFFLKKYASNTSIFLCSIFYVFLYFVTFTKSQIFSISSMHFIITGLTLIYTFVAYYEMLLLEKNIKKIKSGKLEKSNLHFETIEQIYESNFKVLGLALAFLTMAIVSGFFIQSVFTTNIVFKSIFTTIALIIYLTTLVGIKFFNFTVKNSTRNLFIAILATLLAYLFNDYFIYN